MRALSAGVIAIGFSLVAAAGCSSGDSDGSGGLACDTSGDCIHWRCTCNDGTTTGIGACIGKRCADESICTDMCEDRGGLANVSETPTVKDSPECDAYCAKIASLGCDDRECNRAFWCAIDDGQCAEQKRAYLQCVVDTGTWQCTEQGWGASSSCSTQSVSCPGETDGGS